MDAPIILPTPEQLKMIQEGIGEEEGDLQRHMVVFQTWLQYHHYLPRNFYLTPGRRLMENYIRDSLGNIERAQTKFLSYVVAKTTNSALYHNRFFTAELLSPASIHKCAFVLPNLTPDGHRVIVMRCYTSNPEGMDFNLYFKYVLTMLDYVIHCDASAGFVIIYDSKNFNLQLLGKLDMKVLKDFAIILYYYLPFKIKHIHMVNMNTTMEVILQFVKVIMTKEVSDALVLHSDASNVNKYVAPEILPEEYGGLVKNAETIGESWMQFLISNRMWCAETLKLESCTELLKQYKTFDIRNFEID